MASDIEKLIVSLEAKTTKFENALNKANRTAQTQLRKIETQFAQTNKKLSLNLGGLGAGAGALGAAFGADQIKQYADAWTEAGNKLKATSAATGIQTRSLADLTKLANQSRSGITETVDLYTKLARATQGVAKNEQEVADATDIVNKAFKAGGAATSEQAAGILQLSQALGSGVLQGDELRSIRENAPLLAKAIADEFGTNIAGLKKLGAEGALSSDRVFQAILKAGPQIQKQFDVTTATIGDGFTLVSNAAAKFIGKLNDTTQAGKSVGELLKDLSQILDNLGSSLDLVASVPGGKFIRWLNDTISRFEPLHAAFNALSDPKLGDALDGLSKRDLGSELSGATKQALALFDAYRAGLAAISPDKLKAFDLLRQKIADGTIGAKEAKEAIANIVGNDARLKAMAKAFDPLLEKLAEITAEAQRAATAIFSITDDKGESLAGQRSATAYGKARSDFLDTRNSDASRSDVEKQIQDRTKEVMDAAKAIGQSMTEAAARIQAAKEIASEKTSKNTDTAIGGFVEHVVTAESGGKANAKNPNSSATGLGQFIESTWLALFRKYYPAEAANMSTDAILALRNDSQKSRELIEAYARENATTLQKAGVSVDEAALQLAHFLGPQGAIAVLKAAPGTPVADVLGAAQVKANPTILGGGATVDDVIGYAQKRAGITTALTQEIDLRTEQEKKIRDVVAAQAAETASIGFETSMMSASNAERERAKVIRESLLELEKEGITITDAVRAQVEAEADARFKQVSAYDAAAAAADRLKQAQEDLAAQQEEINDAFSGALKGFISDLAHGKSLTDSLKDAVGKLADRLLDIALDNLFGGGGSGGLGLVGKLFGFADGGYTGNGGVGEPAGVVHGKEFVVNARATAKNRGLLEAMNAGVPGYAQGGYVGRLNHAAGSLGRIGATRMQRGANDNGRPISVAITVVTPDAQSFVESQNQIAARTAAHLERTMRTR
ncbi:tape measure protein [Mesorhizobium newzealandense]|uniref:Tape measure protein n=1 Tax=Mesorhizobium newzealandense TaxID=1300302 RepID=A0ABW4UG43_9HYPH